MNNEIKNYADEFNKSTLERKEAILKEIAELSIEESFKAPDSLPIPLRDEIMILPVMQDENKTAEGLYVPEGSAENPDSNKLGIVARLGSEVTLPIRIGMKIWFSPNKNYFQIMGKDGNVYLLMIQHNIHCIATPESYPIPTFRTNLEIRNDERREGLKRTNDDAQKLANMSKEEKEELGIKTDLLGNRKD